MAEELLQQVRGALRALDPSDWAAQQLREDPDNWFFTITNPLEENPNFTDLQRELVGQFASLVVKASHEGGVPK